MEPAVDGAFIELFRRTQMNRRNGAPLSFYQLAQNPLDMREEIPMELRHLRYFVTVAEELHFTRAAGRLGISQAPLSQQIRQLEQEIGSSLFHRLARGVELTGVGEAFLKDARAILDQAARAKATARQVARGEEGMVRVGFTVTTSSHPMIPSIIRDYQARFPGVAVSLEVANSVQLADAVRSGQIDAAFVRTPFGCGDGLTIHPMLAEDLIAALPVGHALAAKAAVPLAALADENFILWCRSTAPSLYDGLIAACRRAGFSPRVTHDVGECPPLLHLVASGLGVSIVPDSVQFVSPVVVTYRPISDDMPQAQISVIQRRCEGSAAVSNLVAMARQAARKENG
jgi:DNA-binding transcriptional LysR family regulator